MAASAGQPFNVNTAATGALQGGMGATALGMGYSSAQGANAYANPFQNQVIGGLQSDAQRGMNMMSNQIGTAATRAGAFGGSRHGVAEGQAMADIQNNLNNQIGNLRYGGYQDAMNQSRQDQQMRMGAANQLVNMGNLGFGMGRQANQDLLTQGYMQQMLNQKVMDNASQQFAGAQQAPYQALQALSGSLNVNAPATTTSTSNQNRGLMDYLMMGAMMYPR